MSDLVYGLRLLRARPGYAAMTILTIALGVGAVTKLFSVAYGVLLRPLPWGDTERLVRVSESRGGGQGRVPGTMMNGSFLAWADSPQTIEGIGTFAETPTTLTGLGDVVRIPVARITPSTFDCSEPSRFAAASSRQPRGIPVNHLWRSSRTAWFTAQLEAGVSTRDG